jgi:hypothetical protein
MAELPQATAVVLAVVVCRSTLTTASDDWSNDGLWSTQAAYTRSSIRDLLLVGSHDDKDKLAWALDNLHSDLEPPAHGVQVVVARSAHLHGKEVIVYM